jgi:hypothetical protein
MNADFLDWNSENPTVGIENEESTFVCFSFSILSFGYRKDIFCAFIGENLRPDIKG